MADPMELAALMNPAVGAVGETVKAVAAVAQVGIQAAGQALAIPARIASAGLEGIAHSLHELQGPLGPVGLGLDLVGKGLETVNNVISSIPVVGTLLGPLTSVLVGIPGVLKDITTSLVGMAAVASPGAFRLWQMALEDVQGVIGQRFLPILDVMREGVRLFGDVLATILPSQEEVSAALSEFRAVFAEMAAEVRASAGEFGPSIRGALIEGLKWLAHWAAVAARAVGLLATRLARTFAPAGAGGAGAAASSVDAAARGASITGFEEYQRQLQTAAFREPGITADPGLAAAQASAASLADIDEQAQQLADQLAAWGESIKNTLVDIWEVTKEIAKFVAMLARGRAGVGVKSVDAVMGSAPLMTAALVLSRVRQAGEFVRGE